MRRMRALMLLRRPRRVMCLLRFLQRALIARLRHLEGRRIDGRASSTRSRRRCISSIESVNAVVLVTSLCGWWCCLGDTLFRLLLFSLVARSLGYSLAGSARWLRKESMVGWAARDFCCCAASANTLEFSFGPCSSVHRSRHYYVPQLLYTCLSHAPFLRRLNALHKASNTRPRGLDACNSTHKLRFRSPGRSIRQQRPVQSPYR